MPGIRAKLWGATCLCGVIVLASGCGGRNGGEVVINADSVASGAPGVSEGNGPGSKQRVPITRRGEPTAVFATRLENLEKDTEFHAYSTITLTKCHNTDYHPTRRSKTACVGTHRYVYNPVEVKSDYRVVRDDHGRPDLSAPGLGVGEEKKEHCTDFIHHCTLVNSAREEKSHAELKGLPKTGWLILRVTASSPKAPARCTKARRCDVLAVEGQKRTALYGVEIAGHPKEDDGRLTTERTPRVKKLPVVEGEESAESDRRVVYSVPLSSKGLVGSQAEVEARLAVDSQHNYAPLVDSYLVLARTPSSLHGRFLMSNNYNHGYTGNTGENCTGHCSFERAAAISTILQCDIEKGRRYINLVVGAARHRAKPHEEVTVNRRGFLRVVHFYEPQANTHSVNGPCEGPVK